MNCVPLHNAIREIVSAKSALGSSREDVRDRLELAETMVGQVARAIDGGRLVPPSFVAQAVLELYTGDPNPSRLNEYADLAVRMWYAAVDAITRSETAGQ